MSNANRLTGLLAEIEAVAGRQAALAVAVAYGGTQRAFPSPEHMKRNPKRYAKNWLVQTVGRERAMAIVRELFPNGGRAEIPSARHVLRRQFVQDNADCLSVPEMAASLEMTERGVRRIKAALRAEGAIA